MLQWAGWVARSKIKVYKVVRSEALVPYHTVRTVSYCTYRIVPYVPYIPYTTILSETVQAEFKQFKLGSNSSSWVQTETVQLLKQFKLSSNSSGWVQAETATRTYHWGLERAWQLTPHETHHSSRVMRTYHTHFGVPLGIAPGWRDDRKKSQACVTYRPSLRYFQQSQPCTLLPSPFWP